MGGSDDDDDEQNLDWGFDELTIRGRLRAARLLYVRRFLGALNILRVNESEDTQAHPSSISQSAVCLFPNAKQTQHTKKRAGHAGVEPSPGYVAPQSRSN